MIKQFQRLLINAVSGKLNFDLFEPELSRGAAVVEITELAEHIHIISHIQHNLISNPK